MFSGKKHLKETDARQIRPEYVLSPDDDLYGSPRSWTGSILQTSQRADQDLERPDGSSAHSEGPVVRTSRSVSYGTRRSNESPARRPHSSNRPGYRAGDWERTRFPYEDNEDAWSLGSSSFTIQFIGAIFLIVAILMVFNSTVPVARQLQMDIRQAFALDFTRIDLPASLARVFGSLPSSGSAVVSAVVPTVDVVAPMRGTIVRPFSVVSPEVVVQGTPGSAISAAAEGLVESVGETQANGYYVTIDHGSFGETFYAHLGRISVRANEYVVAGQTIGYLPDRSGQLTFGYIRGGSYKDPQRLLGVSRS